MERLRRGTLHERFHDRPFPIRLLLYSWCALSWPAGAAFEVRRNLPAPVDGRYGTVVRTALSMYSLALWRNVPPVEYVLYGFGDRERRKLLPAYLFWTDGDGVKGLNRRRGAVNRDVQDKVRFAEICAAHGLPHVPSLAQFRAGEISGASRVAVSNLGDGSEEFGGIWELRELGEFWVKPLAMQGGVGAERWRALPDGSFEDANRRQCTPEVLLASLRARDCLVQPVLKNHPVVDRLTNGSLAALRVVTGLHRDGRTAPLANLLVLPQGNSIISARGVVCVIDWSTGTILEARLNGLREPAERHPDTGQPIVGETLPFWTESLALVQDAHRRAFPAFATLGWDVALTPQGPVLLEANSGWGALAHQVLTGPLGDTALSAIIAEEIGTRGNRGRLTPGSAE